MPLFSRPIPRRAFAGAALGALYGLLILPAPETTLGITLPGLAWFLLSMSLLFLRPLAYHAHTFWGLVWIVWRVVSFFREPVHPLAAALDLGLAGASVALVMTSSYLEAARASR